MTDKLWPAEVTPSQPTGDELETEIAAFVDSTLIPDSTVVNEPADQYPVIRIKIAGQAAPQGSKVAFNVKRKDGTVGKPVMREQSKRLPQFRTDVAAAAAHAMGEHPLLEGPILLDVVFVFVRPASHFNTERELNKQGLATPAPIGQNLGDLSKLIRAIEDSMSKVVFRDDSQVTTMARPRKRWGIAAATYITVMPDPVDP